MGETVLGPINPEQALSVAQSLDSSAPSIPDGWNPLTEYPEAGDPVEGLLTDGSFVHAEYWDGPPGEPDWGGWARDMTARFCSDDFRPGLDLIAWRPFDDGGAKQSPARDADPPVLNQEPSR